MLTNLSKERIYGKIQKYILIIWRKAELQLRTPSYFLELSKFIQISVSKRLQVILFKFKFNQRRSDWQARMLMLELRAIGWVRMCGGLFAHSYQASMSWGSIPEQERCASIGHRQSLVDGNTLKSRDSDLLIFVSHPGAHVYLPAQFLLRRKGKSHIVFCNFRGYFESATGDN